jgi:hypothetical protein
MMEHGMISTMTEQSLNLKNYQLEPI